MRVLNCAQGSDEWKAERAMVINGIRRRPASLAPAMMGVDSNVSRSDLVRMWATGSEREISDWAERVLFPRGHAVEKLAREMIEAKLGEDMFPVTGVDDSGLYLASLDGIDDGGKLTLEIKQWNAQKAADVRAGKCPACDYPQVAQGLMVSKADRGLYAVTDGTPDNYAEVYVERDLAYEDVLRRGWDQLDEDARNYGHREAAPVVVGVSPESLPALRIEVTGMVLASNLREFRDHAAAVFDGINTDLQTDSDFADAEQTVKWCADIESRLDAAKQHALSQTASIDELFRAIDEIKDIARAKRLELDKLVKARKDSIRVDIMAEGVKALSDHHAALAARLGIAIFPGAAVDFAGAMKGKRTLESLRDAVSTTLAHAKIAANELADRMDANLKTLREPDHASLFPDAEALAVQPPDHVAAVMFGRVAKAQEEAVRRSEEAQKPAPLDAGRTVPPRDTAAIDAARRHRASIEAAISGALVAAGPMSAVTARKLVSAIAVGKIPNLHINYGG